MKARIVFRAADAETEPGGEVAALAAGVDLHAAPEAIAEALRGALRRRLAEAAAGGARTLEVVVLGPDAPRLPLQRLAEALLEEARAQLGGESALEELCFVLPDEPALRVFEAVQDGFRIAEQARRWST